MQPSKVMMSLFKPVSLPRIRFKIRPTDSRSNLIWVRLPCQILRACLRDYSKSLCYQLPAVVDHGITIVISPLLALMGNQVAALKAANIAVATINSNTQFTDREEIYKDLSCGKSSDTALLLATQSIQVTQELDSCMLHRNLYSQSPSGKSSE